MVEDVIRGFERTLEGVCSSEGSTDHEDPLRTETCDKETNTINVRMQQAVESGRRSQSSEGRNSGIRRSQTFSPACGPTAHYICKVKQKFLCVLEINQFFFSVFEFSMNDCVLQHITLIRLEIN